MDSGRRIAQRLIEQDIEVRFVFYPQGMDASSFVTSVDDASKELRRLLDGAWVIPTRQGGEHGH